MNTKLKMLVAATGLGLTAGPAMAALSWGVGPNLFQDDDLDFVMQVDTTAAGYSYADPSTWKLVPKVGDTLNAGNGTTPGDVLVAVVDFNTSNGVSIASPSGPPPNQELTAISVIQITSIDTSFGYKINFAPYQGGFNSVVNIGSYGVSGTSTTAAGGAMLALWLDNSPDLWIDAGSINAGTLSSGTFAGLIAQASDGALWEIDGIDHAVDPDTYWQSNLTDPGAVDLDYILAQDLSTNVATFNAGLSLFVNNTGQALLPNAYKAQFGPNAGAGRVDVLLAGSLNGGAGLSAKYPDLVESGVRASSDADLSLTVPDPATLALLGAGLLGFRASTRRRAKA